MSSINLLEIRHFNRTTCIADQLTASCFVTLCLGEISFGYILFQVPKQIAQQ